MNDWAEIRSRVLVEGVSRRRILRETGMHRQTLQKILEHSEPPGYRQQQRQPGRRQLRLGVSLRPRVCFSRHKQRRDKKQETNTDSIGIPWYEPKTNLPGNEETPVDTSFLSAQSGTLAEAKYNNFAIIPWSDYFVQFPNRQPPIQYQPLYSKSLDNIFGNLPPSLASSVINGQYRNFPLRGPRFTDAFCMDNEWKIDRAGFPVTVSQFGTALYNRVTVFSVEKREIMGYQVNCASIIRIRIANSLFIRSHNPGYFDVDLNDQDHKEYLRAPWDECLEICSAVSPIGKNISDELDKGMTKLVASPNEPVKVCRYIDNLTVIYFLSARVDANGTIVISYLVNILAHNLGEAYRTELDVITW